MGFDLTELLAQRAGSNFDLHARYLNPQLTGVVQTLGFDRFYVRGEGCYLYDREGREYFDTLSGFGVFALGRSHPVIKAALHQAIDADLPNLVQIDAPLLPGLLAESLVQRSHVGIERAFLCNSGAESVEAAIKFARAATGRARIAYFAHAYHGLTMGALSINGSAEFKSGFGPLMPGAVEIPWGDVAALTKELRAGDVAALVAEPIQGKGVFELDAATWQAIESACRESGTLLVMDEVQTGLGRTGRFYAHEHYALTPDIITVSKALSGGYVPVAATLTSDKIFRATYKSLDRAMVHSTTFKGNQLGMVAALATLSVFDDEDVVGHAAAMGDLWRDRLTKLAETHEFLSDVRGRGQMIGIEFAAPSSPGARRRWRALETVRTAMFSQSLVVPLYHEHRILTQVAADGLNVIKLLPALVAGEREVDLFVDALDDLLTRAETGRGWVTGFAGQMARGALHQRRAARRVPS